MAFTTLLLLSFFCILCEGLRTQPNKVDILTLLQAEDYQLFGLDSLRGEYKCRSPTDMFTNAQANSDSRSGQNKILSEMRSMLRNCPGRFRVADWFDELFIFPGTKWCGLRNIAENYYDLGVLKETDSCCRDHDFCDDIIQSHKTNNTSMNQWSIKRFHCKCDEALRQCLKKVNTHESDNIGWLYFSVVRKQCFDFKHPKADCAVWRGVDGRLYCAEYKWDETEPKEWQWFDQVPWF